MNGDGNSSHNWAKLLTGLLVAYAVFQLAALSLGSTRGEAGIAVAALVVIVLLTIERVLFGNGIASAAGLLGFDKPAARGLTAALSTTAALLLAVPFDARLQGSPLSFQSGWPWHLPGLFAQAGIAEEALFRGYLFRHLRVGRPFWRTATLACIPFVLVHLALFATLPLPIAAASVLLSVIMSFPLAHLFEIGGNTIWAPALLHFAAQSVPKLIETPDGANFPIVWMAACAVLPYLAFLFRRP